MEHSVELQGRDPVDRRPALVTGKDPSFHMVTQSVASLAGRKAGPGWHITFFLSTLGVVLLFVSLGYLFWEGIGVWGNNNRVDWAWDITNFVFWIEIAHAGTLISAILLLFRQKWRTSINRLAEGMTIFAVMAAAIFPAVHIGRPWFAYWLFPFPNQMSMWTNFKSPLEWDVFAVNTYLSIGIIFWFVGMIPDFATLRDQAKSKIGKFAYGLVALGWTGSARQWVNYERACILLAGIATPAVFSTAGIVSLDFATSILPGWHATIFPPYFIAGAIFSGFCLCLNLLIMVRSIFNFKDLVTDRHIDICARFILFTSIIMAYVYVIEFFTIFYSGNPYEKFWNWNRINGPYGWAYWAMVILNIAIPQTFWIKKFRQNIIWLFIAAILINIGMWLERFVLIVTTLSRTFLPSSWGYFIPSFWDISLFIGSIGLFFHLFCLFVRYLPMINMSEVKSVMPQADPHLKPDLTSFKK
ncbi:hydrogenase [Silvanigrella paludirubra]|uniref:Hydrogenase n=1 Tax=Silvanigrella paludirubra TaxID=2499159 RepID=A0A6N6VXD4_9BACT|nr:NrfD/PsrC family molybdoenzyme membrane anchor subunit [Silvanigrella paludirubra]KAB8039552.1 hydrogenase [Silvanigrella paludirubra]